MSGPGEPLRPGCPDLPDPRHQGALSSLEAWVQAAPNSTLPLGCIRSPKGRQGHALAGSEPNGPREERGLRPSSQPVFSGLANRTGSGGSSSTACRLPPGKASGSPSSTFRQPLWTLHSATSSAFPPDSRNLSTLQPGPHPRGTCRAGAYDLGGLGGWGCGGMDPSEWNLLWACFPTCAVGWGRVGGAHPPTS